MTASPIDTDTVRDDIRAEAARLMPLDSFDMAQSALPMAHPRRQRYRLDELIHVHGEAFVERAYRCLLKRAPDATALLDQLERLQRGDSKIALLGDLRWSDEGRRHGMKIDGLRLRYAFWRATQWPLLGSVIERIFLIAALPGIAREQRRLGQMLHDDDSRDELDALRAEVAELRRRLDAP